MRAISGHRSAQLTASKLWLETAGNRRYAQFVLNRARYYSGAVDESSAEHFEGMLLQKGTVPGGPRKEAVLQPEMKREDWEAFCDSFSFPISVNAQQFGSYKYFAGLLLNPQSGVLTPYAFAKHPASTILHGIPKGEGVKLSEGPSSRALVTLRHHAATDVHDLGPAAFAPVAITTSIRVVGHFGQYHQVEARGHVLRVANKRDIPIRFLGWRAMNIYRGPIGRVPPHARRGDYFVQDFRGEVQLLLRRAEFAPNLLLTESVGCIDL